MVHISILAAMIELEPRFYELQEGSNVIVCAVVNKPTILCPIFFPFDITVETKSHTAGMVYI